MRVKAEDVGEILETLCTMGHARRGKVDGTFLPKDHCQPTRKRLQSVLNSCNQTPEAW